MPMEEPRPEDQPSLRDHEAEIKDKIETTLNGDLRGTCLPLMTGRSRNLLIYLTSKQIKSTADACPYNCSGEDCLLPTWTARMAEARGKPYLVALPVLTT
eukprot:1152402-Pelagomonas_calceolata.AAC.15